MGMRANLPHPLPSPPSPSATAPGVALDHQLPAWSTSPIHGLVPPASMQSSFPLPEGEGGEPKRATRALLYSGRGEVDENLYSGRKEGEGEGARGEDKSTKYRITL